MLSRKLNKIIKANMNNNISNEFIQHNRTSFHKIIIITNET